MTTSRSRAGEASASRAAPPPPPNVPPRPGTGRGIRPGTARQTRAPAPPEPPEQPPGPLRRPTPAAPRKVMFMVAGGITLGTILVIVLAACWGPWQRSSQLAELDAALGSPDEARRLALHFAQYWGPGSEAVRNAIASGRGPLDARIVLARTGKHFDLLINLLNVEGATAKYRAEILADLAEDWPEGGKGAPGLPAELAAWVADPKTDEPVAIAAAHLIAAASHPDAAKILIAGTLEKGASDVRAIACAESIARMVERDNGGGLANLLEGLRGPHRTAIASSNVVADTVKNQAGPVHAEQLLGMLSDSLIQPICLAGLSGPRMELGADPAKRAAFAARLAPMLAPEIDDNALAGALKTIRRHQLIEARERLYPLLGRLGKHQLPGLDGNDVAGIIGGLASDRNPELIAASCELVNNLAERLADDRARLIAAGSLAMIPVRLPALIPATSQLASYPDEPVCGEALAELVGKLYGRTDLVAASKERGWRPLLSDGQRRQVRYDAIRGWMKEHADDTTVRAGKERLQAARDELGRYREEVKGWLDAPPPLGLGKNDLLGLANQIQLMQDMVTKAWSGL